MSAEPDPHDGTGPTPPRAWSPHDEPTPPRGDVPGVTSTGSWVPPDRWTSPAGVPRAARRRERSRGAGRPTPPRGLATGSFARPPERLVGTRRRLVALARVLAGGLVVLAVVVIVAPWFLGGPGPGVDTVAGHLVGAGAAVAATALAAHRRTSPVLAVVAAASVPVILFLVLAIVWWA
ncbi:hypothetical protein PHK61_05085 [Actinomycetospora lutea]|uniref:hypothetical protein n=1 Tax=Actinomycetospora lutea TaxID=663604 RepID=UPI002365089E|nr:hypothetical protein [Actinomycetospora lutea]MDD7937794.1 hypothetical protein [Actinomycetospora lutea]